MTGVIASATSESFSSATRLGGLSFVNQSSDAIFSAGIGAAVNASTGATTTGEAPAAGEVPAADNAPLGLVAFGAISAEQSSYDVGHDVDVASISTILGFAKGMTFGVNSLTVGGFFEYGVGDVENYNTTTNLNDDGDSTYYGGGILARFDMSSGLYTEGFTRLGTTKNEFTTSFQGTNLTSDQDSTYFGIGASLGYLWQVTDKSLLDFNGRYTYGHIEGSKETIGGADYDFDALHSHRIRLGAHYHYAVNAYFTPYIGAAYEYEFDGATGGTVSGVALRELSQQGSTGVLELGASFTPSATMPISFNFELIGTTGQREGIGGNIEFVVKF